MPTANDELTYNCHPSVAPFHESRLNVKALCGPVRSGKSLACAWEWVRCCLASPVPVEGVVVRETYRQLYDTTLKMLTRHFGSVVRYKESNATLYWTLPAPDGREQEHALAFRHGRHEAELSNLLSSEYGFAHMEEPVPAFDTESRVMGGGLPHGLLKMLKSRLTQPGVPYRPLCLSFNPPSTFHWVYTEFFRPSRAKLEAKNFGLWRVDRKDNEQYLPANYYDELRDTFGADEDMIRRFIEGEPITVYPGQRVYPEFSEQHHFAEDLKPARDLPLVIMFDFGLTPVALIGQVLATGRFLILREVQLWDASIVRLADELSAVLRNDFNYFSRWRCWGDPAGMSRHETDSRTCFQILAERGFHLQPGAVSLQARIEAVKQRARTLIGARAGITIDRQGCPLLTEGLLGGYRYPKLRNSELGREPLKNKFSHVANALEYGCTGEFNPIDNTTKQAVEIEAAQQLPRWNPLASRPRRARSWMSF